jgi:ATP-dependent RNA helicase DeaD
MGGFESMNLIKPVLKALDDVGYETPTAIQSMTIPHVLAGRDVLGQAQTGTGKTAAFALPLLSLIDVRQRHPQVLVLAPTRELTLQVAESFKEYGHRIRGFSVLPVYGGQSYTVQLGQIKRGVHVVVATPGRLMDLIKRGSLSLEKLISVVIDEADEMLRMGFIDDVTWILEQTPPGRQIALFSATIPPPIRTIAARYLKNPEVITMEERTTAADTIRQRYWVVKGTHKLDALTRILEAETFDGIIVFVRTKTATVELAEKLEARGYAAEALNGDMAQAARERTVERLKKGRIDILVATDVAARGLDVDRISHVINFDIPTEAEPYIHRIGRTGRAGRSGDAILFVSPRERWIIRVIEKATCQKLELMNLPTAEAISDKRIADFKQSIGDVLASEELQPYLDLMDEYRQEHDVPALDIAAALAVMLQKDRPFLGESIENRYESARVKSASAAVPPAVEPLPEQKVPAGTGPRGRTPSGAGKGKAPAEKSPKPDRKGGSRAGKKGARPLEQGMDRYRIEVGLDHGLTPGDVVGAIANETGLESRFIGAIVIEGDHSLVDLPKGMPESIFKALKRIRLLGRRMDISRTAS